MSKAASNTLQSERGKEKRRKVASNKIPGQSMKKKFLCDAENKKELLWSPGQEDREYGITPGQ